MGVMSENGDESIIEINDDLCVGCGLCAKVCPGGAISLVLGKARVNPLACTGCGHCLNVCRTGAIRWRELPRRAPQEPYGMHGWPRQHRFVRSQQGVRKPTRRTTELGELRDRIRDLQEKADDIVKRIDRL